MKNSLKSILFYLVLIVGLIIFVSYIFSLGSSEQADYGQILTMLEEEKVTGVSLDKKDVLTLTDADGKTVSYQLRDYQTYLERFADTVETQYEKGIIKKLDIEPYSQVPWWVAYLPMLIVVVIFVIIWIVMMNQANGKGGKIASFGKARVRMAGDREKKVYFTDVAGADEEKEELREVVDFLRDPQKFVKLGARIPRGVLLVGPPGSGKSMLSKRLPSILPDMTREEALEVTKIYSVMGMLSPEQPLVQTRPFRASHHTASATAMAGGGTTPRPGEVSLAHKGVLFLDELPEFRRDTLEVLRQPLEDGQVTISRVQGSMTYPSEFMMVCAMNPCKCGWYGDPSGRCTCSQASVDQYLSRVSGPMLDRIDIIVEVPAVKFEELSRRGSAEPSAEIKKRVDAARKRQNARYAGSRTQCNALMQPAELRTVCQLDEACTALMQQAFSALHMTARSYDRVLKVARTIADLDGSEQMQPQHIAEAIQYRTFQFGSERG